MADTFDPKEMIERFQRRAAAVKSRPIPPVEGTERAKFIEQASVDYFDYAIIGDAVANLDNGILTLTIDLRAGEAER
ncbi:MULTISPECIES: hypothetical protein [Ferrimicrobium]|jgi:hypothetical protein|uniref:Uncharacterized protein n=1 Tax=Ferrimicrobium acidiphilum TaxID=121039 RepID=A0ABV3Y2Z2_9ACTN|nr:hypothetical protein [Ferrimicrobium sp.]MCL5972965.1 hypothetical protein [Actinomycetota bacterium]